MSVLKNTKTISFVALIAAMMFPLGNAQIVSAEQTAVEVKQFDENETYDSIPKNVLLDRSDFDWMKQRFIDDDFERKQFAMKAFVADGTDEVNGWNVAMKKTAITIHNFDVIAGQAGNGFELVGLVVAKQKLDGTYNATQPEKQFHDWVAAKYEPLDSIGDIDRRINDIVHDVNPKLVKQLVDAFDEQARHGNVHSDLIATDPPFWIITAGIAICEYDPGCDPEFSTKVRDQKLYEKDIPDDLSILRTSAWFDYFLRPAYAVWVDANHHTYAYADPWQCDYGNCKKAYSDISTGTHDIFASSDGGHGVGNRVDVYVGSCGNGSGAGSYNTVIADFEIGLDTYWSAFDVGYGCAVDEVTGLELDLNPSATWLWQLSGTSDAYIEEE